MYRSRIERLVVLALLLGAVIVLYAPTPRRASAEPAPVAPGPPIARDTAHLFLALYPDVASVKTSVSRSDAPGLPTAAVACSGPTGRYLGAAGWDAGTGRLLWMSTNLALLRPGTARTPLTRRSDAERTSRDWLGMLMPGAATWRLAELTRVGRFGWCAVLRSATVRATLHLDARTGVLRSATLYRPSRGRRLARASAVEAASLSPGV
ncbi:MAG: hypothetical protein IT208_09020 [Chthonomonadales bacterium]|nr:hypothetical protein [Chthonomonadales bacterium]